MFHLVFGIFGKVITFAPRAGKGDHFTNLHHVQSSKWAHSTCTDKISKKVLFDPGFVEGIVHWEVQFTDRIVLMEGEIYFRPQLEIIDNGYLSGVQGYFIVNIFRGMGSLIVPSCSPVPVHRNSPGPTL